MRDLEDILAFAIDACAALSQRHATAAHLDLAPSCLSWDREARIVAIANHNATTFTYASPERTGRVQQAPDRRSDLYSFGVILYELLTGRPPFDAADEMGMIHAHIAKQATPPAQVAPAVPAAVSAIVMRLLAKNAADRYQSAAGLAADLRHCADAIAARQPIGDLVLGRHDEAVQLTIPTQLYGRERACEAITNALARAVDRRVELCLVSGASGVGKSTLVAEIRRRVLATGGMFVEGKFDQFNRNIPYSALRQALSRVIARLLTLDDSELAAWRTRLQDAVERHGRLMIDLVPELELVIGPQPAIEKQSRDEAKVSLERVFERFVHALVSPGRPLVLFLDDLQWVDGSTLGLIEALLANPSRKGVLLIGAYRRSEVDVEHPLHMLVHELGQRAVPVESVQLEPLGLSDVCAFVADTLQAARGDVLPLAELVVQWTGGNPFFVAQLLQRLYLDGLLRYAAGAWHWQLAAVRASSIAQDVLQLMLDRLARLPDSTTHAMCYGACIGSSFSLVQLARLCDIDVERVAADLAPAIAGGLVVADRASGECSFLHDRVQQAAYSLIPDGEREATHLRLARMLASSERSADCVFEIASHLNKARGLLSSREDRLELVMTNLVAGERASVSAAFVAFHEFMSVAAEVLPADAELALWQRTHLGLAEAAYLTGRYEQLHAQLASLLERARDPLVRIAAHTLLVKLAMAEGRPSEAARIALEFLAELGVKIPAQPRESDVVKLFLKSRMRLATYTAKRIERMPETTDPIVLATMEFCMISLPPVSYGAPAAFPIVLMRILELTLRHGHCFLSPVPFLGFAIILARVGSYGAARRYTELAWRLQERFASQKVEVYMHSGWTLFLRWHWEPMRDMARVLEKESYSKAAEVGNLEFMAHELHNAVGLRFVSGDALDGLRERSANAVRSIERIKQWSTLDATRPLAQLIASLCGDDPSPVLRGEHYDPDQVWPRVRATSNTMGAICNATFAGFYDLLLGDGSHAVAATTEATAYIATMPATYFHAQFYFVQALALLRAGHETDVVARNLKALRRWSKLMPVNFVHKALLVEAELASTRGESRAPALYEAAARAALSNAGWRARTRARGATPRTQRRARACRGMLGARASSLCDVGRTCEGARARDPISQACARVDEHGGTCGVARTRARLDVEGVARGVWRDRARPTIAPLDGDHRRERWRAPRRRGAAARQRVSCRGAGDDRRRRARDRRARRHSARRPRAGAAIDHQLRDPNGRQRGVRRSRRYLVRARSVLRRTRRTFRARDRDQEARPRGRRAVSRELVDERRIHL